ncbi:MAG: hypothetical protein HC828_12405 [Blastochloris sp.]|nr:hypothetical protein [Blastochloris sp.]
MPMDRSRYPSDWEEISLRIRRDRAGWKCEWCGIENAVYRLLDDDGERVYRYAATWDGGWYGWDLQTEDGTPIKPDRLDRKPTRIILTTAHLGTAYPDGRPGDKHDKLDCRDENLACLCQRCHLNYDRDEHVFNAAVNRRLKRVAQGQAELWRSV